MFVYCETTDRSAHDQDEMFEHTETNLRLCGILECAEALAAELRQLLADADAVGRITEHAQTAELVENLSALRYVASTAALWLDADIVCMSPTLNRGDRVGVLRPLLRGWLSSPETLRAVALAIAEHGEG